MVRCVVWVECTSVGPVETLRIGFQVDDKVRSRPKGQARLAPSAVKRALRRATEHTHADTTSKRLAVACGSFSPNSLQISSI